LRVLQTTDVESTLGGRSINCGLSATCKPARSRIPTRSHGVHDLQMGEEELRQELETSRTRRDPRSWRARGVPDLKHNLTETLPKLNQLEHQRFQHVTRFAEFSHGLQPRTPETHSRT